MSQVANVERASSMSKYPKRKGGNYKMLWTLYMNGPSEKAEIAITISFRPNGPRPAAAIRHAAEALRRTAGFVLQATKRRIKRT